MKLILRGQILAEVKILKRHLPGTLTHVTDIGDCNDAPQLYI